MRGFTRTELVKRDSIDYRTSMITDSNIKVSAPAR